MQSYYDKDRGLNTVKLEDGVGSTYVFNVPHETDIDAMSILNAGELISVKEGDKPFKRPNGLSDQFSRRYLRLTPLKLTGSQEENELLEQRKKSAPQPGDETIYPAPPVAPEELEAIPPAAAKPTAPAKTEMFEDRPVFRDSDGNPYTPVEKFCITCQASIPGIRPVSVVNGKFTRFQGYKTTMVGAVKSPKHIGGWFCPDCVPKSLRKKAPVKPAPSPPQPGSIFFKGNASIKFEQRGDQFFYQDQPIVKEDMAWAIYRESPCCECESPIRFRTTVSFRGDKPWNVSNKRPLDQKAVLSGKKAQSWICEKCATGVDPAASGDSAASANEKLNAQLDALGVAQDNAQSDALALGTAQEEARLDAHEIAPPPPPPDQGHVPLSAFTKLEEMALDPNIDDKMYRGAAWMLARVVGRSK